MKRALLCAMMAWAACALVASEFDDVLTKVRGGQIDTLNYDEKDFSVLLDDVIEAKDNEAQLAAAYRSLARNDIYLKHTLLIVMIKKQSRSLCSNDGREKLKEILVGALSDAHFWIRTEAVWGLRFFGDTSDQLLGRDIFPLTRDKSEHVRKKAKGTYVELNELRRDMQNYVF